MGAKIQGQCAILYSRPAVAIDTLGMLTISCPQCAAIDVAKKQNLGSEILWFICATCAHVWCAIARPLPYPSSEERAPTLGASRATRMSSSRDDIAATHARFVVGCVEQPD